MAAAHVGMMAIIATVGSAAAQTPSAAATTVTSAFAFPPPGASPAPSLLATLMPIENFAPTSSHWNQGVVVQHREPPVVHRLLSSKPDVVVQLHESDDQLSSGRGQLVPEAGTAPTEAETTVTRVAENLCRTVTRERRTAHQHHVQHAAAREPARFFFSFLEDTG